MYVVLPLDANLPHLSHTRGPSRYLAYECCLVSPAPPTPPSDAGVGDAHGRSPSPRQLTSALGGAAGCGGGEPQDVGEARSPSPPPLMHHPFSPISGPFVSPPALLGGATPARGPRATRLQHAASPAASSTVSLLRVVGLLAGWRGTAVDPFTVVAALDVVCSEASSAVTDLTRLGDQRSAIGHFVPALAEGSLI